MKKSLSYAKEHMFQTFGKIIFAVTAFILMNAFLTVHWDTISWCMFFLTIACMVVINACVEGYLGSEGEDIPALVVGSFLFIVATGLYFLVHYFGHFEDNPLQVVNFCYFTILANTFFSLVEPAIEKSRRVFFKRFGLFAK